MTEHTIQLWVDFLRLTCELFAAVGYIIVQWKAG